MIVAVLAALLCTAGTVGAQTLLIDTVAGPRGLYAYRPNSVAVASNGTVYMSDPTHNSVFRVATDGTLSPFAGPGEGQAGFGGDGGQAAAAQLGGPSGLAVVSDGSLYIADRLNHRIRKVDGTTGIITTVVGDGTSGDSGDNGQATAAQLNQPIGVTVTSDGTLYIADAFNHRVRKVDATTGIITTVAGDGTGAYGGDGGPATAAQLATPIAVAVDAGDNLYIADSPNHRIRKVTAATGIITTIAGGHETCDMSDPLVCTVEGYSGDGSPATAAQLNFPQGVAVARDGTVYIADTNNERIRKVATDGVITTIAGGVFCTNPSNDTTCVDYGFRGDGGPAAMGWFNGPLGIAVASNGAVYVSDLFNHRVRVLALPPPPPRRPPTTGGGGGGGGSRDQHGNTPARASEVSLDETAPWSSSTPGQINSTRDIDYFELTLPHAGVLMVETTGRTDTVGTVWQAGEELAMADSGGVRRNFRLSVSAKAGPVVVAVQGNGTRTGSYTLQTTLLVGYLENPGAESFQSGIGVLSGWVCEADTVEIEINGETQPAAYGTERTDTADICGHPDTGFGLLFNWNHLGDGDHEVIALVDGVELDRATVTVTTLGSEFLRGVSGTCEATDFPEAGETVTLVWQQATQNFVITDGSAPPTGSSAVASDVTGFLENPAPNSFQSGIGVLSGWVCDAEEITLEINGHSYLAGYGTERSDTAAVCGDTNNGFGLLFNWNRLADGDYEVVALADGVVFDRATARVTTLGEEFLRGVAGTCEAVDFPATGQTVTLTWQQNQQNFVMTDVR